MDDAIRRARETCQEAERIIRKVRDQNVASRRLGEPEPVATVIPFPRSS